MAHIHSIYDTDPHFVIDPKTRKIKNDSGKVILIQGDHNSERFTFEIPRYVDGHDMSLCDAVEIHYDNVGSSDEEAYSDVVEVGDLQVSPASDDVVIFSWLISGNATQYKGTLNFAISFQCHDDEGNIDYEFGTLDSDDITIGGRRRNSKTVIERVADILSKWRNDLFGIGKTEEAKMRAVSQEEQAAIAAKGANVLATIPADYTAVSAMAEEAIRTKADGIVVSAEGECVAVNDSSDDYIRGLRVFGKSTQKSTTGKQLSIVDHTTKTNNGITFTSNLDGSIHVKGTATANAYFIFDSGNPIPVTETELIASINGSDKVYMVVGYFTADETVVNSIATVDNNTTEKFVYPTTAVTTRIFIGVDAGNSVDATVYPMIRLATIEDDTYEPYTGGKASPSPEYPQEIASVENPKMSIHRKNLVRTDYGKTDTYEGMTVVITKGLSEVVLNGTTTKPYGYAISQGTYLVPGRYTMSVYGLNDVDKAYLMNMDTRLTVCNNVRTGSPVTFDVTSAGIYRIDFTFAKETTYTNTAVKFQIEVGEMATEYEPIVPFETVTLNHTLPGIPVPSGGNYTDENGQQWVCDEVDFERGVYVQRVYSLVSDYNSDWKISGNSTTYHNAFYRMNTTLPTMIKGTNKPVICTHFPTTRDPVADHTICVSGGLSNQEVYYFVPKSEFPDVETWTNYVVEQANAGTPITTYYILNAPIETPLSESELAAFRALKTNKLTTTVLNDAGAHVQLDYVADTKTYIDNQIAKRIAEITNT